MNHLSKLASLRNSYYAMRHGQSKANTVGLIISYAENASASDYALSNEGRRQVFAAAKKSRLGQDTVIYSSDFSRAIETAEIMREQLGTKKIHVSQALRERNFGNYEKTGHNNYRLVWSQDIVDASHNNNGVESVEEVVDRVTAFIKHLEDMYEYRNILLVSHGDPLQILQTVFQDVDWSQHRALPHLDTAEIRELKFKIK